MKHKYFTIRVCLLLGVLLICACNGEKTRQSNSTSKMEEKVAKYKKVKLIANTDHLTENEKEMLPFLFEAASIMDELFWKQAYGDKDSFLASIVDETTREYAKINYGPWDRLKNNEPFIDGYAAKTLGANFYPSDMDRDEFESLQAENKKDLYTIIRRGEDGNLTVIPYNIYFKDQLEKASSLLKEAAKLADVPGFKHYLELRAEALMFNDYLESDLAWMDMKNNNIEFIIGPIETYEDRLFGYKAAFEAFILFKDKEWSEKLNKFAAFMPELQAGLPVSDEYKQEIPGIDSEIGAYEAVFYAGDCNAGAKTIAINLPNDERVHAQKGTRSLQLKNSMKAKFDHILIPITDILINPDQKHLVTFDAFFENTMFHEVAHGLGIKETINGKGPVRNALKDTYTTIEESKADILGLYMVAKLKGSGELEGDIKENYVTFMAGIFRSIRFGSASAHGKANLLRYNYFMGKGAFTRDADGTHTVNYDKMQEAMNSLSELILVIQGDGDYERAKKIIEEKAIIKQELSNDLSRINESAIPVDIIFHQGLELLETNY